MPESLIAQIKLLENGLKASMTAIKVFIKQPHPKAMLKLFLVY